ncbi:DNA primase catalytic subunit PriS [Methanomassiliicoccus luminyensis]|jgi:DNA primase small subunit|uniref:DNA primase catalytic subunit PriS n=1 Tax=Methanomassiliicoccus luminyensis TaxID=1080712 RepID=UPI00036B4CD4|nr:DNA primase catalytic subunit PriS [Methanomassiliicoccus luminyensis]
MGLDQDFMMGWFRRYYQERPPAPPARFERREFGFMFFDRTFVQRHIGFPAPADLHYFLRSQVPSHAYYSTAYYQYPGAPTMEEKSWAGADLIFDLDADHVPGAESLSYPEMLARIKVELLRLLDDFLLGDLGFDDSDLKIVFSGGRGYHIHVADARLVTLKSHERREIVDYIAGTDLNMEWVFPERVVSAKSFVGNVQESRVRSVPSERSGGWRRRMRNGMVWLVEEMRSRDLEDLRERFPSLKGVPDAVIRGMLDDLYTKTGRKDGAQLMLEKNELAHFRDKRHVELFLRLLDQEARPMFTSEIDEPVTSDIKRLIRLPGSLHGKTGLRVTTMERDELDGFEPLRDAVPDIYTDDPVELFVRGRAEVELRGERATFEGRCEAPAYMAVFMIARKMATLDAPGESDGQT